MKCPGTKPSKRRAGPQPGAHCDPEWLTPEARAEIAQAAAEWNAGITSPPPGTEPPRVHEPVAATAMIAATHAARPMPLSREDVIELITRPVYLGRPRPEREVRPSGAAFTAGLIEWLASQGLPPGHALARIHAAAAALQRTRKREHGAGRPSPRTQYDLAFDIRRGLYHRLVRAPSNRTQQCAAQRALIVSTAQVLLANGVPRRKLAMAVWDRLRDRETQQILRMMRASEGSKALPSVDAIRKTLAALELISGE